MNNELQTHARKILKDGLVKLPIANQHMFKRMYSPQQISLPINDVVDAMSWDKLDWAMQQVQKSLELIEKAK